MASEDKYLGGFRDLSSLECAAVGGGVITVTATPEQVDRAWSDYYMSMAFPNSDGGGSAYGGVSGGAGIVGGIYWSDGDIYISGGVGTPGLSAEGGYDLDGDLSGFGANYGIPMGPGNAVGDVLDPWRVGYSAGPGSFLQFNGSLTYTVNATETYNQSYGHMLEKFTRGFVDTYYPSMSPQTAY